MSRRVQERTDALTVVLHWAAVATLGASFLTGLRISADRPSPTWARVFESILPQGDVFRGHIWAGYALALVACAYVVFLVAARVRRRVALSRERVRAALRGGRHQRWRVVNLGIYWIGFGLLFVAATTGVVHYLMPPFVPHETLLNVHRTTAWLLLLYIAVHVGAQIAHGGWVRVLKIVTPRAGHGVGALVALTVALVGGASLYAVERASLPELEVRRVDTPPVLDGQPHDPLWEEADVVRIQTVRGANHDRGAVVIDVKAIHDGTYLYALFRWPDATRSQKHLPLVKTAKGWKVQQTEYGIQDEDNYYEDKFAVMWSLHSTNAGSGTVHLGEKPLKGRRGPPGGRGLHYTDDGKIVDVWHWKSVRTGSPAMRQLDDNYFGPPMADRPAKKRYTGGYAQDPNTGGGYEMNWVKFSDGIVTPKRLPSDPSLLSRLGAVQLNPNVGDDGEFWMRLSETVPYSAARDRYPPGTVMPSVLLKGAYEGDRGDVHASSSWHEGWWRMEVKRRLVTHSKYDVAFASGQTLYMWVAAFDHAQTRHSYHLRPVSVKLR